jgi:hypothetical protein
MIVVDGKSTLAKNTSLPNDVNFILELTFKWNKLGTYILKNLTLNHL